jgi:hypothetical protein
MASNGRAHEREGLIRFEVCTGAGPVTAFLSRASCRAREPSSQCLTSLADFVRHHRQMLERIVLDKLHAGARSPVVVTARDLVDARPA